MNKNLFNNILDKFIDYLQFEKRFSYNTIKSYRSDILEFSKYLDDYYPNLFFEDVYVDIIRSWIVSMIDNGYNKNSINRKISCLRSFYKFSVKIIF